MEILNISFSWMGIEPTRFTVTLCSTAPRLTSKSIITILLLFNIQFEWIKNILLQNLPFIISISATLTFTVNIMNSYRSYIQRLGGISRILCDSAVVVGNNRITETSGIGTFYVGVVIIVYVSRLRWSGGLFRYNRRRIALYDGS